MPPGTLRQRALRLCGPRSLRWGIAGATIALSALSSGCAETHSSFLHPYGPVAAAQRSLFFSVIGWMMIVVVPVFVLLPWFAWRYRRRNAASAYRPQWAFSWTLEVLIWGIPVIIVAILAYGVWTTQNALDPYRPLASSKPPLEIQVVGLDWKWLFVYPEQAIATVGVVAMPVDRPVHFTLTSATVMQSFFIPSLGSQIYAMAGMKTQLNLLADRSGAIEGKNTQFNGMGFQNQNFLVKALPKGDFERWVATVRTTGQPLDNSTYAVLSERSTTAVAASRLEAGNSLAEIRFSSVLPDFFSDIVDSFRRSASGAPMLSTAGDRHADAVSADAAHAATLPAITKETAR